MQSGIAMVFFLVMNRLAPWPLITYSPNLPYYTQGLGPQPGLRFNMSITRLLCGILF